MSNPQVIESTLSFRFDDPVYEQAYQYPVLYRAMGLEPRRQHPFWIYDAIQQQPGLIAETLNIIPEIASRIAADFVARNKRRILFSGIGASYHLGASAALVFQEIAGLPAEFVDSSEALFNQAVYAYADSMVVGLSASGNTREVVEHVRLARASGALTVAMVNLDKTRLVAESQHAFVAAGGYGMVWDYTTRLAALIYLAIEIARQRKGTTGENHAYAAALQEIPRLMEQTLIRIDPVCQQIGRNLGSMRAAVISSAGRLLPVSWEMCLRFEEMAHYPSRGRSLVDFLHGGPGYIAGDIATILLVESGEAYPFALRAALVTQTVKTPCFAVVEDGESTIANLADQVIRLPVVPPVLRPFVYLLPAQLVPYYLETSRPGGNPDIQNTDKPRYARGFDVAYPPASH